MSCSPVRASALCGWLDCSGVGEGEAAKFCESVMYSSYRRRRSASLYHVTYLPGGIPGARRLPQESIIVCAGADLSQALLGAGHTTGCPTEPGKSSKIYRKYTQCEEIRETLIKTAWKFDS